LEYNIEGAQIHCARTRMAHTPFGRRPSPSLGRHACILAGGHRSSVELRSSRSPSSNRRRRCRAGVSRPPTARHFGDVPPMLRPLFTSYLLPLPPIAIHHAERHEFVGNRAESEARAVCPDSTPTLMSAEGRHS
jgi:hypothetical protein